MLIKFSDNPFKQIIGITFYNLKGIIFFVLISVVASAQYHYGEIFTFNPIDLPIVPVSILGGALAIFLGFRNNSAYDRWWEARKIWGGVVNASRAFGTFVISYSSETFSGGKMKQKEIKKWREDLIHRHIAWLYALKMHLRKLNYWEHLEKYLSEKEVEDLRAFHNKPTQLLNTQGLKLQEGYHNQIIDDFRHVELGNVVKELYNLQGMAERIKSTIFPYYYNYFTNVFLWLFIICLPFALVQEMGWGAIPMSSAISFVFMILEKAGATTEDPFEGRAADTPISTISRNIEIDLLEMLGSETVPAPLDPVLGRFGVKYID